MIEDIVQQLAKKFNKKSDEVFQDFKKEYRLIHFLYPYADKEHKRRLGLYILETKYNQTDRQKRCKHDKEKE